jgi:hypothetical protein
MEQVLHVSDAGHLADRRVQRVDLLRLVHLAAEGSVGFC